MKMLELARQVEVFVLAMTAGENRWNTTFVRQFTAALDEVEASEGPAALVTTSEDHKFFSNGLDVNWLRAGGDDEGGDPVGFATEAMTLLGRMITLPLPTVCAIGGHAFVQTVLHARRWNGEDALAAGVVQQLADADAVVATAIRTAAGLARLGGNRRVMGWMKEHIFGENAAINGVHGPAHMLRHSGDFAHGPSTRPAR